MTTKTSLQDLFLAALQEQNVPVNLYLVSGIKLQGTIEAFDNYVIQLRSSAAHASTTQLVYKHAVSTVSPNGDVRFTANPTQ